MSLETGKHIRLVPALPKPTISDSQCFWEQERGALCSSPQRNSPCSWGQLWMACWPAGYHVEVMPSLQREDRGPHVVCPQFQQSKPVGQQAQSALPQENPVHGLNAAWARGWDSHPKLRGALPTSTPGQEPEQPSGSSDQQ